MTENANEIELDEAGLMAAHGILFTGRWGEYVETVIRVYLLASEKED